MPEEIYVELHQYFAELAGIQHVRSGEYLHSFVANTGIWRLIF